MKILAIALIAGICACCDQARADDAPRQPDLIQPGPESAKPPEQGTFYILTEEQLDQVNALVRHLTDIVEKQKLELERLREQTKPVGSCT